MKKKKKKPVVLIFIILLIALYVIIYILPNAGKVFVTSYIAEYGKLTISDDTTGYLVRSEKVYASTKSGEINPYIQEGTLVREHTRILEVNEGVGGDVSGKYQNILDRLEGSVKKTGKYKSPRVGIVSYYADGHEAQFTPKKLKKLTYEDFQQLSNDDILELSRSKVNAGEPVYKIVDRTKWYIVCYVDLDHKDRYEVGTTLRVEFEDQNCEAVITGAKEEGDKLRLVLRSGEYYENFTKVRVCNIRLVTYDERGLLILNDSITEKDGKQGVYVKTSSDKYIFVPIQVYATNGEYSMIASGTFIDEAGEYQATVDLYDEVQKNP